MKIDYVRLLFLQIGIGIFENVFYYLPILTYFCLFVKCLINKNYIYYFIYRYKYTYTYLFFCGSFDLHFFWQFCAKIGQKTAFVFLRKMAFFVFWLR